MELLAFICIAAYAGVGFILLVKIWRRDVYFAVFMSLIVIYSVVPQWGYYFFPEISAIVYRMYFGLEALMAATIFSIMSLLALYYGFKVIYLRVAKRVVLVSIGRRNTVMFYFFCFLTSALFVMGYIYFRDKLSYANASDENFMAGQRGLYTAFIQMYKFSVFSMLVMYAVLRNKILRFLYDRLLLILMILITLLFFVLTTLAIGNRTDPLALAIGLMGFEYYKSHFCLKSIDSRYLYGMRLWVVNAKKLFVFILLAVGVLFGLSVLEDVRGGKPSSLALIDVSPFEQMIIMKDYSPPFHVLIGAMANEYVDPWAVLLSNTANSLMFLKVDYLQAYIVNQWDYGLVTRSASPAMFAFAEGYVALGWLGFIYNGIVWAAGISIWRLLSLTSDQRFNSLAFGITIAMAATVARSQSMYFIKDIYLFFIPVVAMYCMAAGLKPIKIKKAINNYK